MTERTCTEDGCDKAHRAKGLCATHYNHKHQPNGHPSVTLTCQACSAEYLTKRTNGRYCSLLCRDYARWGPRAVPVRPPRPPKPDPYLPFPATCAWCGAAFLATRKDKTLCSRACKIKAKRVRRRGRQSGDAGTYTWTQVIHLFLLFNRRCAYCEQPVDGQPDPDHVVPLSRGGNNSLTNILPCCRLCNSDKRDLLLTEWNADRQRRGLKAVTTEWHPTDPRVQHLTSALLPVA